MRDYDFKSLRRKKPRGQEKPHPKDFECIIHPKESLEYVVPPKFQRRSWEGTKFMCPKCHKRVEWKWMGNVRYARERLDPREEKNYEMNRTRPDRNQWVKKYLALEDEYDVYLKKHSHKTKKAAEKREVMEEIWNKMNDSQKTKVRQDDGYIFNFMIEWVRERRR